MFNAAPFNSGPFNDPLIEGEPVILPIQQVITGQEGFPFLDIRQIIYAQGFASLEIQQEISPPSNTIILPIKQIISGTGSLSLAIRQQIFRPGDYMAPGEGEDPISAIEWEPAVFLDGVDISERLTGQIRVQGEEGAARTASFTMLPEEGEISLTQWVGKTVTIDYVWNSAEDGPQSWRLFTGIVDVPSYDPINGITLFDCTDDLQKFIEAKTREQLTDLIGGRWSKSIFNDDGDLWQYAQDRLSTIPVSLDLDVYRSERVTDWLGKEEPDYVYDGFTIEDQSVQVQLASRRDLINTIDIGFDYRFIRGKARRRALRWRHPLTFCGVNNGPNLRFATKPTRDMIESAIRGTGWAFGGGTYDLLPPAGKINCGASSGGVIYWNISESNRQKFVVGFTLYMAKQFEQDLTETYKLLLTAPQSIEQVGEIKQEESGSLDAEDDGQEDESEQGDVNACGAESSGESGLNGSSGSFSMQLRVPPDPDYIDLIGGNAPGTVNLSGDYYRDRNNKADNTTEDAAEAMETLLHKGRTQILAAHRQNVVSWQMPIQPYLDRMQTIELDYERVAAKGKVRYLAHIMDMDSGRAVTEIAISVSRTDSEASATDSDLIAPNRPDFDDDPEIPPPPLGGLGTNAGGIVLSTHLGGVANAPPCNPDWTGYIGNARKSQIIIVGQHAPAGQQIFRFYPERFVVESPEIEAEARDPVEMAADASYTMAIPNEPLTMAA